MHRLKIITSTVRPGRKGIYVANWITQLALEEKLFEVELLDLAAINLPMMDEPNHPRLRQYQHEHTKKWSGKIDSADAFIIVASEYNFGMTAPLKNALDYLFQEWNYKPVAFVSYGGQSGGLRAVQMIKQVVTTLKMMPVTEGVPFTFFEQYLHEETFSPGDNHIHAARTMMKELLRWSQALKPMRTAEKA